MLLEIASPATEVTSSTMDNVSSTLTPSVESPMLFVENGLEKNALTALPELTSTLSVSALLSVINVKLGILLMDSVLLAMLDTLSSMELVKNLPFFLLLT